MHRRGWHLRFIENLIEVVPLWASLSRWYRYGQIGWFLEENTLFSWRQFVVFAKDLVRHQLQMLSSLWRKVALYSKRPTYSQLTVWCDKIFEGINLARLRPLTQELPIAIRLQPPYSYNSTNTHFCQTDAASACAWPLILWCLINLHHCLH
jgi:hypothetical protein